MISRFRNRSRAQALQGALERYERMVADGADQTAARAKIADAPGLTPEDTAIFALAARLQASGAAIPEPSARSVEAFARRLRAEQIPDRPGRLRFELSLRPRFQVAPALMAAAVAVFAVLLVPGLHSLPGDGLYGLKTASESARAFITTGPSEARLRIGFAEKRFEEVDDLLARAANQALGGVGTYAAGAAEIDDPELTRLVGETLARAGIEIVKAAQILIAEPNATAADLAQLVTVSRQGQDVAESAAVQLPTVEPPARTTATTLARVEAQAEAVQRLNVPPPTPGPCATSSPSPAPTTTPVPTWTPTPSLEATPEPIPTASPTATPCVSPSPSPTPTPVPTAQPDGTPAPVPAPTDTSATAEEPTEDGNSMEQASVQSADQRPGAVPAG